MKNVEKRGLVKDHVIVERRAFAVPLPIVAPVAMAATIVQNVNVMESKLSPNEDAKIQSAESKSLDKAVAVVVSVVEEKLEKPLPLVVSTPIQICPKLQEEQILHLNQVQVVPLVRLEENKSEIKENLQNVAEKPPKALKASKASKAIKKVSLAQFQVDGAMKLIEEANRANKDVVAKPYYKAIVKKQLRKQPKPDEKRNRGVSPLLRKEGRAEGVVEGQVEGQVQGQVQGREQKRLSAAAPEFTPTANIESKLNSAMSPRDLFENGKNEIYQGGPSGEGEGGGGGGGGGEFYSEHGEHEHEYWNMAVGPLAPLSLLSGADLGHVISPPGGPSISSFSSISFNSFEPTLGGNSR